MSHTRKWSWKVETWTNQVMALLMIWNKHKSTNFKSGIKNRRFAQIVGQHHALRDDQIRNIRWHYGNGHCPETLHPSLLRISREYWLGRGRHNLVLVSNIAWNATTSRPWKSPRGNKEGTFLHYRVAQRTFLHYSLSLMNNLEAFAPKSRKLRMEVVHTKMKVVFKDDLAKF